MVVDIDRVTVKSLASSAACEALAILDRDIYFCERDISSGKQWLTFRDTKYFFLFNIYEMIYHTIICEAIRVFSKVQ